MIASLKSYQSNFATKTFKTSVPKSETSPWHEADMIWKTKDTSKSLS
jgi:hypothetical protein